MHSTILLFLAATVAGTDTAPSYLLSRPQAGYRVGLHAETGFLAPLWHKIRFGRSNTRFDYVNEGGQGVLFPYTRFAAEVTLAERHMIGLLYQPLELNTRVTLARDVTFEQTTFRQGTPTDVGYSFPFWRLSYWYDVAGAPDREIGLGAGLQLRNATIIFETIDGRRLFEERDVGPVPLLAARVRTPLGGGFWMGGDAAGIWAPVRYLNGGDSDVEGAIVDASLRLGLELARGADLFVNVRYLAGGASGTSDDGGPGDGFTSNWLHFLTVSLGATLR